MDFKSPSFAALVGVFGVMLGSLIQALVARSNRLHERRLALEVKRAEERIECYTKLVRHLITCEQIAGRQLGSFRVKRRKRIEQQTGTQPEDGLSAQSDIGSIQLIDRAIIDNDEIDEELAARLATFGSAMVGVVFAFWNCARLAHSTAEIRVIRFEALLQINPEVTRKFIDPTMESDLRRLPEVANMLAGRYADKMVNQMQAELEGLTFWRKTRGIKNKIERRRDSRQMAASFDFVEDCPELIDVKLRSLSRALGV